MRRLLLALALATAAPLSAQVRTADPAKRGIALTEFPRVVQLAERVYGYEEIRSPGFTTVSMFVVGDSGVLLADGQGSAAATRTMLQKIDSVAHKPVKWYVVGSDHGDHTAGNSALPGDARWIVHPASHAQMRLDSTRAPMSGNREVVDLGGISVEVLFLGRAHTGGDLMVHVPGDKILFMSEAYLNRVFPAMRSAYPSEWLVMLDRALAMDVTRYIPGHGFIEEPAVSREELRTYRAAVDAVIREVRRHHAAGRAVAEAIAESRWGEYGGWLLAEQQAPIAVRRIYEEIEGRLAGGGATPLIARRGVAVGGSFR